MAWAHQECWVGVLPFNATEVTKKAQYLGQTKRTYWISQYSIALEVLHLAGRRNPDGVVSGLFV